MPPNKRRGPAKPSRLKAVPDPATESAPSTDTPDTPFPLTGAEIRAEALKRAQKTNIDRLKASAARRAAGEKTRLELYRAGELPIEDWTDDEVSHGRPADLNGLYQGPQVNFTGKQNAEIRRELLKRGEKMLHTYYFGALKVLEEVARFGESEPSRVKAANLMIERIAGRTVEKIEIKSSDPWQDILDEVLEDEVLERMQDTTDA